MKKIMAVGIAVIATFSAGACGAVTPAPTLEELESQVNSLANDCMMDSSQECEQRKDDFCDALSAYIDKNGSFYMDSVDPMTSAKFLTFGSGCPGLYLE